METNIQKWGNSLGVRLPKHVADKKALKEGSRVRVTETEDGLAIIVVKKNRRTLGEMLKGVTKDQLHEEVTWGAPVGKELW